ncbi:uncharacterized protein LOC110738506 [Chenopodium quinoa]|uniref:uncharacterized protein LOC110738506 n=1 Tax=Chenopodium quinoa TaxID=63459 RepID=UPI000B7955EF|nr:uncharacterized protein LOC110738506 [Chenopodium quinoa]
MEKRVRDETDANAKFSKYIRRLASGFKIEKEFQKLYTDTKFQEVQTECTRMMYCYPREETWVSTNLIHYVLEDRVWIVPEGMSEDVITDRRWFYSATFNTDTKEVLCDCRKFETHERYIVSRWHKDILRKHTQVKVWYHDPNKTAEVIRYNKFIHPFEPICEEAAMVNDETVDKVLTTLENLGLIVRNVISLLLYCRRNCLYIQPIIGQYVILPINGLLYAVYKKECDWLSSACDCERYFA